MDIQNFIKTTDQHYIDFNDGIYRVHTATFQNELNHFMDRFIEIQSAEKSYQLPFHLYEQFPNIEIKELAPEIFTRKQDLLFFQNKFAKYLSINKTALEIGGWNGWLTSYLSSQGLQVVTTDIFGDERNGLKSRKHHQFPKWLSVQTDISKTDIYTSKFDVIIFNHCLQFYTNPVKLVEQYKALLNKGGIMLILGNTFFKNYGTKENTVTQTRNYFKEKYQFDIQFYPSKGFFNYEDFDAFIKNSFKFISYKFSILGRLNKILKKEKSGILYYIHS